MGQTVTFQRNSLYISNFRSDGLLFKLSPSITIFHVFRIYFTPIHLAYEPKCGDMQLPSRCKITHIVKITECFCTKNTVFLRQKHSVSIIETQRFYDENTTNMIANEQPCNKLELFIINHILLCCDYLPKSHFSSSDS